MSFSARSLLHCRSLALLAMAISACSETPPASQPFEQSTYETRHFIEKASRLLRGGALPTPSEEAHWLATDRATVVAEMMADEAFGLTVLDFGLYMLGARPLNLRPFENRWHDITFASAVYSHPSAVHAALETMDGGNFFALLEEKQPLYLAPIARYDDEGRGDDLLKADFESAFALFSPTSSSSIEDTCDALRSLGVDNRIQEVMRDARFQESLTDGLRLIMRRTVYKRCEDNSDEPATSKANTLSRLKDVYQRIVAAYAYEASQDATTYPQRKLTDIRDARDFIPGLGVTSDLLTREGFWRTYVNSSTNYNRKRAQFVLDRFFCDDLTPVDLPNPMPHGSGQHASDPACQSCHYRLDPMGGFFRQIGSMGRNREGSDYLDFDDMAELSDAPLMSYLDFWKDADSSSGRTWNVGYVRDPADPARNTYGSSLSDLLGLLKTAPEVRQCVVKRLSTYVFGPQQVVDGRWLEEAGKPLAEATDESSGEAFKATLKTFVLSQAFAEANPNPETCYDRLTGDTTGAVPCRIAWIVENNCKTCHSGSSARAGLDLTRWVKDDEGRDVFAHVADDGSGIMQQLSRAESFARIRSRLSTVDEGLIMPPRFMAPDQRLQLLRFVDAEEVTP